MNTPRIETQRLILRKFSVYDGEALYKIFSDEEANQFLPWFPLRTMADTKDFYEERFGCKCTQEYLYNYAICLKEENYPIGYIHVAADDSYDLGYGLRKKFWHQGIVTEAGRAIVEKLRSDGIPYITATHDINNPRSGSVMKRLGMKYCYSYEELWQPKNFLVVFRMYQLNLDGQEDRVYQKYWNLYDVHFVEREI